MGEWLSDNWVLVAMILAYLLERLPEIPGAWKRRARILVEEIERYDRYVGKGTPKGEAVHELKTWIANATTKQDAAPMHDLIAAAGDDKHKRSPVRKVADAALHLLPFYSRVRGLFGRNSKGR